MGMDTGIRRNGRRFRGRVFYFLTLSLALTATVRADQLALVGEAQANAAASLLMGQGKAILWCGCCHRPDMGVVGEPKQLVFVSNAYAKRWDPPGPNFNPDLFTVILQDTRGRTHNLDLAYVHVLRNDGMAHSVGKVLGFEHDPCTLPFDWYEVERAHTPQVVAQWECGASENAGGAGSVICALHDTDLLTIKGAGRMAEYEFEAPWYRQNINTVTIEHGVTSIPDNAFYKNGVTSISIPASVTAIGRSIFFDAPDLTSVTIPNGVITIADEAFYGTGLKTVTIPGSVTSVGKDAFALAPLTSVTIDNCEGLVTIGENAFPEGAAVSYTGRSSEEGTPADPTKTLSFELSGVSPRSASYGQPQGPSARTVNFFRSGSAVRSGSLTVYGAANRVISTVEISDAAPADRPRRQVGSWDLRDRRGWVVPNGTYHVRGTVLTKDCREEGVELAVEVK